MRTTLAGILWIALTIFLVPVVRGRIMDEAPGWVWRLIYLACVLLGVAVVLASNPVWPRISRPQERQPLIGLAIIAACAAVSIGAAWWILLGNHIRARLEALSTVDIAQQPPGTVIAGIPWRAPYAHVRLFVTNKTKIAATNVELNIRTDRPIVAVGQSSNLDGVSIQVSDIDPYIGAALVDPRTGARVATPLKILATELGYTVLCKAIKGGQTLKLEIASVGGFGSSGAAPTSIDGWIRLNTSNIKFPGKEYATWLGHPGHSDSIYAPLVAPAMLYLTGKYVSAGDAVQVNETIPVKDMIAEAIFRNPAASKSP